MLIKMQKIFTLRHNSPSLIEELQGFHRSEDENPYISPVRLSYQISHLPVNENSCNTDPTVSNQPAKSTYEKLKVKYKNPCCHKKFSLRHPSHDLSTTLRRSSEQPFDFTMHYLRHRESPTQYVMVNRLKNVANHLSGACRINLFTAKGNSLIKGFYQSCVYFRIIQMTTAGLISLCVVG